MGGCLKGCLGRVAAVVVLAVAAWVGWQKAPAEWKEKVEAAVPRQVRELVRSGSGEDPAAPLATPELAEATLDRFERFRAGADDEDRLLLGDAELSSVVRYALPGLLPPGVAEPGVDMSDGRIFLSARVAVEAFPELPTLEEVVGLLPDTVPIRMGGSLGPGDGSTATLYVDLVQIRPGRGPAIPLPDRFIPEILRSLGREDREGLPPNAMSVPLPTGLRAAYVRGDSLVLVADR